MKLFFMTLLMLFSNDPKEIAKINSIKKEAEEAYLSGNYELAAVKYSFLSDSLNVDDDLVTLNLGHSYFHLGDTSNAKLNYGKLGMSSDKKLKSIAYQQLGVMSKDAGKPEQALQQLKAAIKADPANKDAIYNYEVVKKLLEEQKKQQQDQDKENQDQSEEKSEEQNKDQQNQDQRDKEGAQEDKDQQDQNQDQSDEENKKQDQKEGAQEQKEEQQEEGEQKKQQQKEGEQEEQQQEKSQAQMTQDKLEEMGISEEKARQLLEAMRQSEIRYLQSQKRKATKRPPSGKPDW